MHSFHIALAIEPVEDGKFYAQQPLHCTLMHWFSVHEAYEHMVPDYCAELFQTVTPVSMLVGEIEMFGDNHDVPVFTIEENERLRVLHDHLMACLSCLEFKSSEPHYVGEGYRPHITMRSVSDLEVGQRLESSTAYLSLRTAAMNPPGTRGNSQILGSFQLA